MTHEKDVARFPLLTDAFSYALAVHGGQAMKGSGIPYMAHVMGVASIALYYGADEEGATAALLHDAIEDADDPKASAVLIKERFGLRVASIVEQCTDAWEHPKPDWCTRKQKHIDLLRREGSPSALLVYASDKLQNARAILKDYREIGDEVFDRFKGKRGGTLWYYRACLDVFRARGVNPRLLEEIDRTLTELENART